MKKQSKWDIAKDLFLKFKSRKSILQITLDDTNAAPIVFYKGKRIRHIVEVQFLYETDEDKYKPTELQIKYFENNQRKVGDFSVKTCGFKR